MTVEDTAKVLAAVALLWPHSNVGDSEQATALWHRMLGHADFAAVEGAVRELAATGREHAPPVGLVAATVAARAVDAPDWDEAWVEIDRLIHRHGSYRRPMPGDFSHPTIAAFAIPAWMELCMGPARGAVGFQTHYAQQRDAYKALAARGQRNTALHQLGAPRRRAELQRFQALLPQGDA